MEDILQYVALIGIPIGLCVFTAAQYWHIIRPRAGARIAMTTGCAFMSVGMIAMTFLAYGILRDPYDVAMFGMSAAGALLILAMTFLMAAGEMTAWQMRRHERAR